MTLELELIGKPELRNQLPPGFIPTLRDALGKVGASGKWTFYPQQIVRGSPATIGFRLVGLIEGGISVSHQGNSGNESKIVGNLRTEGVKDWTQLFNRLSEALSGKPIQQKPSPPPLAPHPRRLSDTNTGSGGGVPPSVSRNLGGGEGPSRHEELRFEQSSSIPAPDTTLLELRGIAKDPERSKRLLAMIQATHPTGELTMGKLVAVLKKASGRQASIGLHKVVFALVSRKLLIICGEDSFRIRAEGDEVEPVKAKRTDMPRPRIEKDPVLSRLTDVSGYLETVRKQKTRIRKIDERIQTLKDKLEAKRVKTESAIAELLVERESLESKLPNEQVLSQVDELLSKLQGST